MPRSGTTRESLSRMARRRCTYTESAEILRSSTHRGDDHRFVIRLRRPLDYTPGVRTALCLLAGVLAGCAHGNNSDMVDAPDVGPQDAPATASDAPAGCKGLPCDAIYVAATGSDTNTGIQSAPLSTIGAGIKKAAMHAPAVAVYVQLGKYNE